jgi:hypothetical protein
VAAVAHKFMYDRHADLCLGQSEVTILVNAKYLRRNFKYQALGIKANSG